MLVTAALTLNEVKREREYGEREREREGERTSNSAILPTRHRRRIYECVFDVV